MYIDYFGIRFRRLRHQDIELLRQWRNAEWLQPYMHDQRYITPEMQEQWFQSIDNLNNWYFLIETKNGAIGTAALKHINFETGVAEPGIMMGKVDDSTYIPSSAAMLFLGEVGFHLFGLKSLKAYMYESHKRALSNNLYVGARVVERFGDNSVYTEATKESFEDKAPKLRKSIKQLTNKSEQLAIYIEQHDRQSLKDFILASYKAIDQFARNKFIMPSSL